MGKGLEAGKNQEVQKMQKNRDTGRSWEAGGKIPAGVKGTIRNCLLLLFAAVLTEICLFNFRSIQSLFYEEHKWEEFTVDYSGTKFYDGNVVSIQDEKAEITIQNINFDVKNVRLELEPLDSIDLINKETGICYATIDLLDEGCGEVMYRLVIDWPVLSDNLTSQFIWIQPMGEVRSMNINVSMPTGHLFKLNGITINAKKPLDFSTFRFLAVWLVYLLCYGLRRQSAWWKEDCVRITFEKKVVLCVIFLVFFGISFFIMAANPTIMNDSYNPYQELAWALDEGQVSLLEQPPQELISMENPYDHYEKLVAGFDYKFDYAYYDGAYYIYHGILPCLLFYLPLYHLTGLNMPNSIPVFFCCLLFGIGLVCLMRQIIIRYFPQTPFALLVLITLTGLFGCQLPFFITQPHSYHLTVICAVMLIVWGLYFWISSLGIGEQRTVLPCRLIAGAFCMALVAAVRPPLLIYSLLALPLFDQVLFKTEVGYNKKDKIRMLMSLVIPYVIVAVPVMYYNYIRFDSFFDFGFHYNLTNMDSQNVPFSLEKMSYAIYEYLIKLPEISYKFPYLLQPYAWIDGSLHTLISTDTSFGSILFFNSFLFAIAVVIAKRKEFCKRKLFVFSMMLLTISLFLMILDVEITGCVIYRYQADFAFALFIMAWLGILWLQEFYKGKISHNAFRGILTASVFLSVVMNSMLWFLPDYIYSWAPFYYEFSLLKGNTKLYYDIYYGFNFW